MIRLRVDGRTFSGWTSIAVTRSIESAAAAFELGVTSRYPGAENPIQIRPGSRCSVWIGDDRVVSGFIDAVAADYDATTLSRSVSGRSATADLVDCSAVAAPGKWSGVTVEAIAAALAAPYGVDVVVDPGVSTGGPVARHRLELGETVVESIERLAVSRGLLVTDDAAGRLVLTRAGSRRTATALEYGANILKGSGHVDASGVFAEYRAKGQRAGNDQDFGAAVAAVVGTATDPDVTARARVLILPSEKTMTTADAKKRAEFEAATRAGRSIQAQYTVAGWRDAAGDLWTPNTLIEVRDPVLGIAGELLIAEVVLTLDDGGALAVLTVAPAAGYRPDPLQLASKRGGVRAASGLWQEIAGGVTVRGVGATKAQARAKATPGGKAAANDGDE